MTGARQPNHGRSTRHEPALSPSEFRARWESKAVLRAVYRRYYERIAAAMGPGPSLEIGAGSGNLRDEVNGVFASDITWSQWLDVAIDAQRLPIASSVLGNIVGVDVLHHLEYPLRFLEEAQRALRPGGRVVFVEPAITPLSRVAFKLGHPEPVRVRADPLSDGQPDPSRHPFDGNQAIPTLLLSPRYAGRLADLGLRVVRVEWFDLAAYPLSGGFRPWQLLRDSWVDRLLAWEERWELALGRWIGFRLLLVIERPVIPV